jgi:hypothetical protein
MRPYGLIFFSLLSVHCGLFEPRSQTAVDADASREAWLATCTPGEPNCPTAKERLDGKPCADFPDAGYAFQAPGGGPRDSEVDEAVANRLKSCGLYADLFTGKPWRFSNQGNVAAAQTPAGEKALRALLVAKKREEFVAISAWLEDLLRASGDSGGPDYSQELAQALDALPPQNEVMLYLARKHHPAAEALIKDRLDSQASATRIAACRAIVDVPTPELLAEAKSLAENDSEQVWRDLPDGEHMVKVYPVREMCSLTVQIVEAKRTEEKKQPQKKPKGAKT